MPAAQGSSAPIVGDWRRQLAEAVRDPRELCRRLKLPADLADTETDFPVLVPAPFLARMRVGDPADPLLRQVLATPAERAVVAGFGPDPVGEQGGQCQATPGLLRKYHGRALLITTGACAVHCRYCFRRHFPYQAVPTGRSWWAAACAEVAADPSVEELILSGGDPLVLPDANLAELLADFATVPHLRRIRIHTRLPIVLPDRVDQGLLSMLEALDRTVVVVLHANHPAEFDAGVDAACMRLRQAGAQLFNQAVLLAGVNDEAQILAELCRRCADAGVVPYYLHQLDPVAGAAHFAVPDETARELMRQLYVELSGYLLPCLVREHAGSPGKSHMPW